MSEKYLQFKIVVVGGGPAGLAAACAAAESGARVALVDNTPWLGGQIWRGQQAKPSLPQAQQWLQRVRQTGNITILDNTSIVAALKPGVLLAEQADGACEIHAQKLIIATGARELLLPFPGWTLPGVMGAGGLQVLAKHGWPVAGQRVVVAGSGPLLLAVADGLKTAGAKVIAIYEQASLGPVIKFSASLLSHPSKVLQGLQIKTRLFGVPHRHGVWPVKAQGDEALSSVTFTNGQQTWSHECDFLACGFGLVPNTELPLALGCALSGDFVDVNASQMTSIENVYCAGEPTGIGGVDSALVEGQIAGYAATGEMTKARQLFRQRSSWHKFRAALANTYRLRPELKSMATDDSVVCRCEDVTFGRIKKISNWREAKLQTRCGMGACQGRTCGAATNFLLGWGMQSVRPPTLPAKVEDFLLTGEGPSSPH